MLEPGVPHNCWHGVIFPFSHCDNTPLPMCWWGIKLKNVQNRELCAASKMSIAREFKGEHSNMNIYCNRGIACESNNPFFTDGFVKHGAVYAMICLATIYPNAQLNKLLDSRLVTNIFHFNLNLNFHTDLTKLIWMRFIEFRVHRIKYSTHKYLKWKIGNFLVYSRTWRWIYYHTELIRKLYRGAMKFSFATMHKNERRGN